MTGLARPDERPEPAARSLTILGATGSIGSSTLDLVRRNPQRYRVEAVTAGSNAAALAKLAREVHARFAVVADPAAYRRPQGGARRHRHRSGRRRGSTGRSRAAPGRLGDGGDRRRRRAEADACRDRARRHCRARQQGMPRLRRRPVHARGRQGRRHRAAGRFRAQRHLPGARRRPPRGRAAHHPHGFGRPVPHLVARGDPGGDARAGVAPSQLVDGAEGHHRLGHA